VATADETATRIGRTAERSAGAGGDVAAGSPPVSSKRTDRGAPEIRGSVEAVDNPRLSPATFYGLPFTYIWPAIAIDHGPLGQFVRDWSRATLARLVESGGGSLGGEFAGPVGGATGRAAIGQARASSSSFSPLHLPSGPPWVPDEGGAATVLFTVLLLSLACIAIFLVVKWNRERGSDPSV
jgi:hypothetical protein